MCKGTESWLLGYVCKQPNFPRHLTLVGSHSPKALHLHQRGDLHRPPLPHTHTNSPPSTGPFMPRPREEVAPATFWFNLVNCSSGAYLTDPHIDTDDTEPEGSFHPLPVDLLCSITCTATTAGKYSLTPPRRRSSRKSLIFALVNACCGDCR